MQPNYVTNTDSPARNKRHQTAMPMWNADGLLNANDHTTTAHAQYDNKYSTPQFQNGRVIGISGQGGNEFPLFTQEKDKNDAVKSHVLYGIQNRSPLSDLYFSKANIDRVQSLLRYNVWSSSGGKYQIGEQSETELVIIMRAMYLQHSKNLPYDIAKQVMELNQLVIDYCLPKIMSEVKQYIGYMKNIEYLPQPIPLPLNVSSAGTRTLSSVTSTF